ncbi:hypothetical protein QEN19_004377 [Hanseniaspora menglaensis]
MGISPNNNGLTNNNDSKTLYTVLQNKRQIGKNMNISTPKDLLLLSDEKVKQKDQFEAKNAFNLHRSGSPMLPNFGSLSGGTNSDGKTKKQNTVTEIMEGNVIIQHDVTSEDELYKPDDVLINGNVKPRPVVSKTNSWVNLETQPLIMNTKTLKLDTNLKADDYETTSECNSAVNDELDTYNLKCGYLDQSLETLYKKYSKINKVEDSRIKNGIHSKYAYNEFISDRSTKNTQALNSFSISISKKSTNYKRNRYNDISPYNYNRVKLQVNESSLEGSNNDYINASYLKIDCLDKKNPEFFIASQGPTKNTYKQFWQMCFQQGKISQTNEIIIVMVTPLVENNREKCFPYWPSGYTNTFIQQQKEIKIESIQTVGNSTTEFWNELELTTLVETFIDSHYYTIMQLRDLTSGEVVKVHHLYYDKWEDFSSPNCFDQIIRLIDHVNDIKKVQNAIPIVSHCSAGVGRTGTFLALFYLYNSWKRGLLCDSRLKDPIESTVKQLRLCRMKMVQTFDQFQFIYKAIKQKLLD